MKTCKICQNVYIDSRTHCPTCGAFGVDNLIYDCIPPEGTEMPIQLVVAHGAQRQNYARTVRIDVRSCDDE